jgi:hypothetical protein
MMKKPIKPTSNDKKLSNCSYMVGLFFNGDDVILVQNMIFSKLIKNDQKT